MDGTKRIRKMADKIKNNGNVHVDQIKIPEVRGGDILSLARRKVMKAGLATVPAVLTLRGTPLFGKPKKAADTASIGTSIAAGSSLHGRP